MNVNSCIDESFDYQPHDPEPSRGLHRALPWLDGIAQLTIEDDARILEVDVETIFSLKTSS